MAAQGTHPAVLWDLLLPETNQVRGSMAFYPLGGRTLEEAKERLAQLVAQGLVPQKIP